MFKCACGQIARSKFEFDRHPSSALCQKTPVEATLEDRPDDSAEVRPEKVKYPRLDPREVWK